MDPYAVFTIGKKMLRSSTHKAGHMTPQWTDKLKFDLDLEQDKTIDIALQEEDVGSKDDVIGVG